MSGANLKIAAVLGARILSEAKGGATVSVAPVGAVPAGRQVSPTESDCYIVHPWVSSFRTTLKFWAGWPSPARFESIDL